MAKKKDPTKYLAILQAIDTYCEDTENYQDAFFTAQKYDLGIEVKLSIKKMK